MFNLYLKHGRITADESLQDWGPDGPTLENVKGIHQTYGNAANVFFKDRASMLAAQTKTRWSEWDDNALTMNWESDCVVVVGEDGIKMLYGDWGLILSAEGA
jgi:hypothetical protein